MSFGCCPRFFDVGLGRSKPLSPATTTSSLLQSPLRGVADVCTGGQTCAQRECYFEQVLGAVSKTFFHSFRGATAKQPALRPPGRAAGSPTHQRGGSGGRQPPKEEGRGVWGRQPPRLKRGILGGSPTGLPKFVGVGGAWAYIDGERLARVGKRRTPGWATFSRSKWARSAPDCLPRRRCEGRKTCHL